MHVMLRKARMVVLGGIVAGSVALLASPAGAVGARPVDPTSTPSGSNSSAPQPSSVSTSGRWGASAPGDSSWWF
jgi:hypothetical protein